MDYLEKLEGFTEEQCLAEFEKISNKLHAVPYGSQTYKGLVQLYEQAQMVYNEKKYIQNYNMNKSEDIIEIGEITTSVVEPDYSATELVNAVVQSYYTESK